MRSSGVSDASVPLNDACVKDRTYPMRVSTKLRGHLASEAISNLCAVASRGINHALALRPHAPSPVKGARTALTEGGK
jgi:hypothetical protein